MAEPAWAAGFNLNPNPAAGEVRFTLPTGSWNVRVLTVQGQTALTQQMQAAGGEQTLPTADLPAGVYVLQVEGAQGRVTRKFWKQ